MRIGYAKLGRNMKFQVDTFGFQGDAEAANLLGRLSARNPNVEWVLVGRNDAGPMFNGTNIDNPWQYYDSASDREERRANICTHGHADKTPRTTSCVPSTFDHEIINTIAGLDGMVVHVGQHAPLHMHIPMADKTWAQYQRDWTTGAARPYDWAMIYGMYLMHGLRKLGDRTDGTAPVTWIVSDPRNKLKARDVKWPTGCDDILAQYDFSSSRPVKHERFLDDRSPGRFPHFTGVASGRGGELWTMTHKYRHAGLELMMLGNDWATALGGPGFHDRAPVGIATTSAAAPSSKELRRSQIVAEWLLRSFPDAEVHGKWDKKSLEDVPDGTVQQHPPSHFYTAMESWRTTLALPIAASGWTTAKVYQAFATNTVCFIAGRLDDQGYVLPSLRPRPGTKMIGSVGRTRLYSVRTDWTDDEKALAVWLRCDTPVEYATKANVMGSDPASWAWAVTTQRGLLARRWGSFTLENAIEEKQGLHGEF